MVKHLNRTSNQSKTLHLDTKNMIKEKMLELLLLRQYLPLIKDNPNIKYWKMSTRLSQLELEFLEPYRIDSPSKEV